MYSELVMKILYFGQNQQYDMCAIASLAGILLGIYR
jgi:hypothetical protein